MWRHKKGGVREGLALPTHVASKILNDTTHSVTIDGPLVPPQSIALTGGPEWTTLPASPSETEESPVSAGWLSALNENIISGQLLRPFSIQNAAVQMKAHKAATVVPDSCLHTSNSVWGTSRRGFLFHTRRYRRRVCFATLTARRKWSRRISVEASLQAARLCK